MKLQFKLIFLSIFILSCLPYLYSQEKQYAEAEVKQSPIQEETQETDFGLQNPFEPQGTSRIEIMEEIMKEQEKTPEQRRLEKKQKEEELAKQKAERKRQLAEQKAKHRQELKAKKEELAKQKEEELAKQKVERERQLAEEKARRQQELEARQEELARQKAEKERKMQLEAERREKERLAREEQKTETTQAVAISEPELEPEPEEKEYYVDIGDVLDISVWQIPDLSRSEVIVRPDGKISFPLIGDIKATGLTLTQLDNIITEKLKAYVRTPEVSIMIRSFGGGERGGIKVVVLGEILSPGVYTFYDYPAIIEAIASAGGYTKYAVLNSIMIIRGDVRTKPEVIRVNLAQILKSAKVSENVLLKPNDIVYVPRSFIGNLNTFLEIFQPAIAQYLQTLNAKALHNTVHRN